MTTISTPTASETRRTAPARRRLARQWPALALVLVLAALARPVLANDNKAYPGSMCEPHSGAPDIFKASASVFNGSFTLSRTVTCPFVRDNTTNSNGTADLWVFVQRINLNGDPLRCEFRSTRPESGGTAFTFSDQFTGTGLHRLEISIPQSVPLGAYVMLCQLPPRSVIHTYAVPEY